jgi:hypothetical protein
VKALSAFWLPVIGAVIAMPAIGGGFAGGAGFGGRANALGGNPASRGASIRPLGGFPAPGHSGPGYPGRSGYAGRYGRSGRSGPGYAYGYSFYVPNYYDGFDDGGSYTPGYGAPVAPQEGYAPPVPQQPVVINQYFGAQPLPPQGNEPQQIVDAQSAQGDVIGTPQNYYLIAYKNHAVYAALAYWVEDKTLHYVTTQNTHNQASLDLIDVTLTKSLNQSREVPFTLPGQ